MTNDKVVYYCGGKKPVIELLVSIFSLRKHYDGEIVACLGETSLEFLPEEFLKSNNITVKIIEGTSKDRDVRDHWKSRWKAMSQIDGGRVLHPDCDIIYNDDIEIVFEAIKKTPGWITSYHTVNDGNWYEIWPDHVEEYKKIDPDFDINDPFYIEFGLLGWVGKWPYALDTSKACEITKDDQTAMSYVLMKNGRKAHLANFKNPIMRRARAYYRMTKQEFDSVLIWHCHNEYAFWWNEFLEAHDMNYMGLGSHSYIKKLSRKTWKMLKNKTYPSVIHAPVE